MKMLLEDNVKSLPGAPEDTTGMTAFVIGQAWVGYYPTGKVDELGVILWFPPSFLRHATREQVELFLLFPKLLGVKRLRCYPHQGHPGARRALVRAGFARDEDGSFVLEPLSAFNWPITRSGGCSPQGQAAGGTSGEHVQTVALSATLEIRTAS